MAIEQSRQSLYQKDVVTRGGSKYSEPVYPWKCHCDFCNKEAHKWADTAGDAADMARKDGFSLVPAKAVALPMKWQCRACKEKVDEFGPGYTGTLPTTPHKHSERRSPLDKAPSVIGRVPPIERERGYKK